VACTTCSWTEAVIEIPEGAENSEELATVGD